VEWLLLLLYVHSILGQNLKPDASYVDVSCGFTQSLQAIVGNALKEVITTSYSILNNSPLTDICTIQYRSWKSTIK
jgi:hypothetical protein